MTSCAALLLTVAGCAARSKTVTLDVHATHPVSVAPIAMEPGAAKLVAVGTYKVGQYKAHSAPELRRTPYLSTFSDLRQGV